MGPTDAGAVTSLPPKPPKMTEEACTQTVPEEHCPPPYVDVRSPLLSSALDTPLLTRTARLDASPCMTPAGQCTPLLDSKLEHCNISVLPAGLGMKDNNNTISHTSAVIYGMGAGNGIVSGNGDASGPRGLLTKNASFTSLSNYSVAGGNSVFANTAVSSLANCEKHSETSSAMLPICRICHMPGELDDEQEMLISPCRCAGTLQFIHNTCLQVRKWTRAVRSL